MILVVGDIHEEFKYLNSLINEKRPSIILQVGDFGYWPEDKGKQEIKNKDTKIYFCDGNHEDHESLKKLKNNEIQKDVFYMKRGSTLDLPDGRRVLFMGGAFSHDWRYENLFTGKIEYREPGVDWFPEHELVTEDNVKNTPDVKIDIVISHTSPKEFFVMSPKKEKDPSRENLSYILKKYKPKLWFFGHFHIFKEGFDYDCKWLCLAHPVSGRRWWVGL